MTKWSTAAIAFAALSLLPAHTAAGQEPPSSRWFELGKAHLAKRGDGYVFVQTVTSTTRKERFWALVEVNNEDGSRKCEWLKTIEPEQKYRFECSLEGAAPGQKYPARVRVYGDIKLSDREIFFEPVLHVTPDAMAGAGETGAIPAKETKESKEATIVPDGVIEGDGGALPAIFKPTWYRRIEKGFSLRAYENSGDLTVTADELLFVDGKKTVRIPYARIQSLRWEPMPGDIANHWVVVRFTNDEGKADGVAFRDGGRMGLRQGTGMIYQTARRAASK
jgi:hypothetical protein